MMIATSNNEVKAVLRVIKGVIWCPFCDRSRLESTPPFCEGCRAEFSEPAETPVAIAAEEPEAKPEAAKSPSGGRSGAK